MCSRAHVCRESILLTEDVSGQRQLVTWRMSLHRASFRLSPLLDINVLRFFFARNIWSSGSCKIPNHRYVTIISSHCFRLIWERRKYWPVQIFRDEGRFKFGEFFFWGDWYSDSVCLTGEKLKRVAETLQHDCGIWYSIRTWQLRQLLM